MTDYSAIIASNAALWKVAKVVPSRLAEATTVAKRLCAPTAKARYRLIEQATGVPWYIIAVIHEREASQNFTLQLAQGDPLGQISRNVPRGIGPFFNHPGDPPGQDAFYRGALVALNDCAPYASRWKDWTPGGALTILMLYNGRGYEYYHENSPYLYGATDQQQRGKFVSDGVFDPNAWDTQLGCAAMLKIMATLDSEVFAVSSPRPKTGDTPKVPTMANQNVLDEIEQALQTANDELPKIIGFLSNFIPQLKGVVPFLNLLPIALNAVKAIHQASGGTLGVTSSTAAVVQHLTPGQPDVPALGPQASTGG